MALLGKIRKHSWLLIVALGLALLSFVIDPKILSNLTGKDPNIIGKVDGEEINHQEYIDQINFQRQFRRDLPATFLSSQAWENLVDEKLLNQQAEKLGIETSEKDFWNAISKHSIYSQVPYFQDKKGNFNTNKFKFYLTNLEKTAKNNPQASEEYKLWTYQKQLIPKQLLVSQYLEMPIHGLNTTIAEATLNYQAKNASAKIDYILLSYAEYEKKYKLSIKDEEILTYIKTHAPRYKRPATRDLGLVIFPSQSSPEDIETIKKQVDSLAEEFKTTTNDSLFTSIHSEIPYNSNYYTETSLPPFLKDFVKNAHIGDIYGPTRQENVYIMTKLTGKEMRSEATRSSHILITYKGAIRSSSNRSKEEAKKIADTLYATIKSDPTQFKILTQKSDDPSTTQNKGSLGWTNNNAQELIPQYQKFLNENPKGAIGIAETPLGYHIIQIDDKSPLKPAYQLVIILKSINPSKKTETTLYSNATRFIQENNKASLSTLINNARKKGYQNVISRDIVISQPNIKELNSDSDGEIIRWAFDEKRKPGQTKLFTTSNKDYIIAYISDIQSEGLATIEKIKDKVTPILKKKKLTKILFNNIQKHSGKDLEGLAAVFSKKVKKANVINFNNPTIQEIGREPKVIGAAFGLPLKQISKPIAGEQGVFIIHTSERIKAPKISDYTQEIQANNALLRRKSIEAILKALKDKAKIEDYRNKLFEKNP
ncbi:MAG: SurA N-terminal domain-containing protein [Flavobacteriales bacterium AspAUS03]